MKRPDLRSLSAESRALVTDCIYLPSVLSAPVLVSQLTWLLRAPRRYLRLLRLIALGRYRYDNGIRLWLHGIVDFARGAHLARLMVAHGSRLSAHGSDKPNGEPCTVSREPIDHDPPFVHLHAQFADDACTSTLVAAELLGVPFSFRSHTSPNPQLIDEKVWRAQFIVSASLYDKRVLVHWCGERAAGKIHVNRLGVPLDRFAPAHGSRCTAHGDGAHGARLTVRGSDRLDREPCTVSREPHPREPCTVSRVPPLILAVGTLCPKKGFEYLIRACRVLADREVAFRCLIVGSGPDRNRLEDLIALLELRDAVTLSEYLPQEGLRELFREAAVFALPCIFPLDGNVDVIPLVLQEAMAMGRPVVSTPISGIPELIQDGVNGLLAPEKDHEALAEAAAAILRDPSLASRLGRAARETIVQRFDVSVNARELAALFEREVPGLQRATVGGVQVVEKALA